MIKLDVKDKKILSELDMNARIPLSRLAKKVRLSRDVVNYRIKRLEKKGVIEGYYTIVDTTNLGLIYCRTFFKYRKITKEVEKDIFDYCKKNKYITWIINAEGKYNLSIMITAKGLDIIEETYDDIISRFGNYLQNPYISIGLRIWHSKHNYLYGTLDKDEKIFGGNKIVKIDKTDKKILEIISNNARLSLIEISKRVHCTPKVINYRIKRLEKEKVILAFRAKINSRLLGYDQYKIFLTLQNYTKENRIKLITFLRNHPNIFYITKPMGMHNLEFEMMVKNMNELHEKLIDIKSQFNEIIVDYEITLYYHEPLIKYFPSLE